MKKLFLLFMILPFVVHAQNAMQTTREEAIAAVKLAIAKKREWVARVEREWAEEEVAKLSAR